LSAPTIRRAQPADLDAAARLFTGYLRFYGKDTPEARARDFIAERLARQDSVFLLAEASSGEAIGFTQLYPAFASLSLAPSWILNDLYVDPPARGLGAGEALMQAARDVALHNGAAELMLQTARDNAVAQQLYEKLGWLRDDEFLVYTLDSKKIGSEPYFLHLAGGFHAGGLPARLRLPRRRGTRPACVRYQRHSSQATSVKLAAPSASFIPLSLSIGDSTPAIREFDSSPTKACIDEAEPRMFGIQVQDGDGQDREHQRDAEGAEHGRQHRQGSSAAAPASCSRCCTAPTAAEQEADVGQRTPLTWPPSAR
jgi:ribosomal protein S18 acetylase RimI-like enzyme